jgi:ABC-2 type transport system ATP-binding protein
MIFRKLVKQLSSQGKIILYCSHVLEVVEKVCSHLIILRKGNLVAHDSVNELQKLTGLPSLEDTFSHLVQEQDAEGIVRDIAGAMRA